MYNKFITVWNNLKKQLAIKNIILFSICLFSLSNLSCKKDATQYKVGDVFILKKGTNYTTAKINTINRKIVEYTLNDYEISIREMGFILDIPENYTNNPITSSKKEFDKLNKVLIQKNK